MGYTRAHVLLNLLNEFRKSDKSRRLPSKLSPFLTEFNEFNNTGLRSTNVRFFLSNDIDTN